MALFGGGVLLGLEAGRRGESRRFTLKFALDGDIVWPDVDHVAGWIVYSDPRQNHSGFTHFDLSAKFTIDSGSLHDHRDAAGYGIGKEFGIPGNMDIAVNVPGSDDGVILYDGIPTDSAWAGDGRTATDAGVIPQDGVSVHIGFFSHDSVSRNPALALLAQIFLRLYKAAQVTGMDVLPHIPQSPDAVQPRILGMGDVGDFILFLIHLASPRSFLDLAGGLTDSSVSTYSLIMESAWW